MAFNVPKPHKVKVTKYECPRWIDLYGDNRFPDENGNLGVDPVEEGCVLVTDGQDFAYIPSDHDMASLDHEHPEPTSLCTTDETGMCMAEVEE